MYLAIDVDYDDDQGKAWASGVLFSSIDDKEPMKTFTSEINGVAAYQSGQFYKRELPCIIALIDEHQINADVIIVDGFCDFNGAPCLGAYLHQQFPDKRIIGVAKNPHRAMAEGLEVYRGDSKKPLFVTASGMNIQLVSSLVASMAGKYRFPDLLKLVDSECRKRGRSPLIH